MFKIEDNNFWKRTWYLYIIVILLLITLTIATYVFGIIINDFKGLPNVPVPNGDDSGLTRIFEYIKNNGFVVPFVMLILALIPIPYLFFLNILSTVVSVSPVLGIYIAYKIKVGFIITLITIPHMIFEIFGLCIIASLLYSINKTLRIGMLNLFKRDKKKYIPISTAFMNLIKGFIVYALPSIIIAAILESIFTVWMYDLFL